MVQNSTQRSLPIPNFRLWKISEWVPPKKIGMIRLIIHLKWRILKMLVVVDCLLFLWIPIIAWFLSSSTTFRSDCCRWFLTSSCAPEAPVRLPWCAICVNNMRKFIQSQNSSLGGRIGHFEGQNPYILAFFTTLLFFSHPHEQIRQADLFHATRRENVHRVK